MKTATEQGITGEVIIGKSTPQGQREERINERHTEQHQSKTGVSSRAPERIVSGRQVNRSRYNPVTAQNRARIS